MVVFMILFGLALYGFITFLVNYTLTEDKTLFGKYWLNPPATINSFSISSPNMLFPVSRELSKRIYGKTLPVLAFSSICFYFLFSLTLLLLYLLGAKEIESIKTCFTFPLAMLIPANLFGLFFTGLAKLGKINKVALYSLMVQDGFLTYFYIGGYENNRNTNSVYYFNHDRILKVTEIKEYNRFYLMLCDVEREVYRHQAAHLSLDNITPTNQIYRLNHEKIVIPKIFDNMEQLFTPMQ